MLGLKVRTAGRLYALAAIQPGLAPAFWLHPFGAFPISQAGGTLTSHRILGSGSHTFLAHTKPGPHILAATLKSANPSVASFLTIAYL